MCIRDSIKGMFHCIASNHTRVGVVVKWVSYTQPLLFGQEWLGQDWCLPHYLHRNAGNAPRQRADRRSCPGQAHAAETQEPHLQEGATQVLLRRSALLCRGLSQETWVKLCVCCRRFRAGSLPSTRANENVTTTFPCKMPEEQSLCLAHKLMHSNRLK